MIFSKKSKFPNFSPSELNPKILKLFEIIQIQGEEIQKLRDEIAIIKGLKPKPEIKPSNLDKEAEKKIKKKKRRWFLKREKTKNLNIHKTVECYPDSVPEGSKFKGFKNHIVQDILIQAFNTCYKMAWYKTPNGTYISGKLPEEVQGHFGVMIKSYILYQNNQCHVTQPLILEQLGEFGIDISSGQLSNILTEGKELFHKEKDELLTAALEVSSYIQVDDTGARHNGKNGFCTCIGNEFFTWFKSTSSKSRINFLSLLRGKYIDYVINEEALDYMKLQNLPVVEQKRLEKRRFSNEFQWSTYLKGIGITQNRHIRIITEGALVGSLFDHGFNPELVILSDDAGQFNVLLHALCWIHAERTIHKIVPFNDIQRMDLEKVRTQIWNYYFELKEFKLAPTDKKKEKLQKGFDEIFGQRTCFATLNCALKRLYKNKKELLLVLDRPEIPLHNNAGETDVREYVTRRKISGGTRSENGRKSRDSLTSLKKTCRKNGVSFWEYLLERTSLKKQVPWLPDLVRQKVQQFQTISAVSF